MVLTLEAAALLAGAALSVPPPEVCRKIARQIEAGAAMGDEEWPALRRQADALDPAYAD